MKHDATTAAFNAEAVRGTIAVAGTTASVLTLNEWVMLSTLAFIALQAVYLLRKWWREEREHKQRIEEEDDGE